VFRGLANLLINEVLVAVVDGAIAVEKVVKEARARW
jgi:hypothetical protein